jgi:hypothetical protein
MSSFLLVAGIPAVVDVHAVTGVRLLPFSMLVLAPMLLQMLMLLLAYRLLRLSMLLLAPMLLQMFLLLLALLLPASLHHGVNIIAA